jgi:queuine/archaeosine tRNA-ribosyltransferase
LNEAGGAHKFQGWNRNLLTACVSKVNRMRLTHALLVIQDSGGFQFVSLSKFTTITEEGALFESPFTGEPTMLTVCDLHHLEKLIVQYVHSQKKVSQYNTQSGPTLSCSLTT